MGFDPDKVLKDVDLSKKVILITGATSGIGFETARILYHRGAKVYIAARNTEKANNCIQRIENEKVKHSQGQEHGKVLFHHLELADPALAKKSAEEFLKKEDRLDVLINNAATIVEDRKLGPNGVQDVMLVNLFSPFVFTSILLPLLKKTSSEPGSDVRIVNVSSREHRAAPSNTHFKSKEDFNIDFGTGFMGLLKSYGLSKLAQVYWTRELARRLSEEGSSIIALTLHPGVIYTENTSATADRFPFPLSSLLRTFSKATFSSVQDGAGTPIIAAVSPSIRIEKDKYQGGYLEPMGKLAKASSLAQDDERAKELWDTTESLLKEWNIL